MPNTFDIREAIAEIPVEEATVDFTFDLKLAKRVKELRAGDDEAALIEAENALALKTYTAELMSVPKRRRHDIYEESLEKLPATRDFLGRVDEKTEFERGNFVRVSVVAAAIKRIVSPESGVIEENLFEAVKEIHDNAPEQIFNSIERKVQELNNAEDEQDALHKSADF